MIKDSVGKVASRESGGASGRVCAGQRVRVQKLSLGLPIAFAVVFFGLVQVVTGGDGPIGEIDPVTKWAWSSNVGWVNFDPQCTGCEGGKVYSDHLEGYVWGENVGWIRLGSHSSGGAHSYVNSSATDYGVNRNPDGELSGYAWGANVGWIRFDPENGGVSIDPASGAFDGHAWAENVGWIRFQGAGYGVVAPRTHFPVYLPVVLRNSP